MAKDLIVSAMWSHK